MSSKQKRLQPQNQNLIPAAKWADRHGFNHPTVLEMIHFLGRPYQPAFVVYVLSLLALTPILAAQNQNSFTNNSERYFALKAVDHETGRGIPLVEFETNNHVSFVTDSAGIAAIHEPGLMGQTVYLHVRSHGYEFPENDLGFRGIRVHLKKGSTKIIQLKRNNVAERLYRVTGQGIYRDSILIGNDSPIEKPLLNAGVMGQDTVRNAIVDDQLLWFWGDTKRAGQPLGNFKATGARSKLPHQGGLDPEKGINLQYFQGNDEFVRPMLPLSVDHPVWLDGMMVVSHKNREKLICHYKSMADLGTIDEHGLATWNRQKQQFERSKTLSTENQTFHPFGNPVRVRSEGKEWFYFHQTHPLVRVRAKKRHIFDPNKYQTFTPLEPGTDWQGVKNTPLERDKNGTPVWEWKSNTPMMPPSRQKKFVNAGILEPEKNVAQFTNIENGKQIDVKRGHITWNPFRKRWILIFQEQGGDSPLGEIWYAEGDTILGPWVYSQKVITHDQYTMYNVKQHPYFAKNEGKTIFFEGTYTHQFSGNPEQTPRYDYNQIMYRLQLNRPRLFLPVPVYEFRDQNGRIRYRTRNQLSDQQRSKVLEKASIPFYALPPNRTWNGSTLLRQHARSSETGFRLRPKSRSGEPQGNSTPLFAGLPSESEDQNNRALVALYEYHHPDTGLFRYRPKSRSPEGKWSRSDEPILLVWKSPALNPPREPETKAADHDPEDSK